MLIGILSDTHDQVLRTRVAVAVLVARGAEALVHCGDLTGPDVVFECTGLPAYFVFGNCDYDRAGLSKAIEQIGATCLERGGLISLGGRRLGVTHGDSEQEIRRLALLEPDYLFSGHTHQQSDIQRGPTRWINPGALHRAPSWTVVLLDLESNHALVLPIINAKMQS
jgi:putative phosphoesterase